ncbi:arrestin domain-containing protein 3-like [Sphaeramia orbicularis]|uniref:arrestin domain-containing protein 3-like n=1 Tax=Sphaeramia orbicularis TaxID=375764 RepID=UPI001180CCAA|nr:arrestin domain-containing protein 3-like [Sphaeramia orbicularis]
MPTITSFTISYYALNKDRTFSEGDILTGLLTLNLEKEIGIRSLFVKVKGDADVYWTERSSTITSYSTHRRLFKMKQCLIPEETQGTVLPPGSHVFKFSFKMPERGMPSSFKRNHGKVVYKLEAKLSRGWMMDRMVEKEITFVSKAIPNIHRLMLSHISSTDKHLGIFSKGSVHMDVIVERRAYAPGETMKIVAKIDNSSAKEMTPKFSLIQDVVYRANKHAKNESDIVYKKHGDCIDPKTQMEITCAIKIPPDQMTTIQNCDIISVQYHVKVCLDVSFSFNPEIQFPVVIIPFDLSPDHSPRGDSDPALASGAQYNVDSPPLVAHSGIFGYPTAQGFAAPPPGCPGNPTLLGMSGIYPTQASNMTQDYNSHQSFNTFRTVPVNRPVPSASVRTTDSVSQSDEAPPSYSALFPSCDTNF